MGISVTVTDYAVAKQVSDGIILGKSFAFVPGDLLDRPALAWVKTLVANAVTKPRVISLFRSAELPGVQLGPIERPAIATTVVTSDKALYREGADVVNLLVCDPFGGDSEVELTIELNGQPFAKRSVRLTPGGAGAIALRDLPCGDFEICATGAPEEDPACTFTVAEYRLSPLVAALDNRRLDGDRLTLDVTVSAFGVPVNGLVQVELLDRGRRIERVEVPARDGKLTVAVALRGDGPHTVNFQLAADPGRTATIPLVGSRAAERTDTVFSTLGADVLGTLLPSEDAREVRGIYLRRGGMATSPVRLERVDTRTPTLTTMTDLDLCIAVIDPTLSRRPNAIDLSQAQHPAHYDEEYRRGEQQFQAGDFTGALVTFVAARGRLAQPHPNYAYFIACCHARLGARAAGIAALRTALRDGWHEMAHLRGDPDLAALHDDPQFATIAAGGVQIVERTLKRGESLAIDVTGPLAFLAIGAFVDGKPWEGHAAIVPPAALDVALDVPRTATPGERVTIELRTPVDAYLIVKDARLLSADTPTSRLAGQLKSHVDAMHARLGDGIATELLSSQINEFEDEVSTLGGFGGLEHLEMAGFEDGDVDYALDSEMTSRSTRTMTGRAHPAMPQAFSAPRMASEASMMPMAGAASMSLRGMGSPAGMSGPAGAPRPMTPPASAPPRATVDRAPEVVFAGLVESRDGRASVTVELGDVFADYVVEAFAIAGVEWASATARFRAEKVVFAAFEVPPFVRRGDTAVGRLVVGGGGQGTTVEVTCDGAPVALTTDDEPVRGPIRGPRAELAFVAQPGDYVARIVDLATGDIVESRARVDEPGKLRRIARTVQFLQPGKRIARRDDPSIISLRALPGLDQPFTALCDATADYGHACCEQTAAKLLAACTMYMFAGDDRKRRSRAEEIVIAGVRRERSMFLPRKGFKMYPDSSSSPDGYFGPLTARYLWNLDLLRPSASRALVTSIDDGLEMARDATTAYKLEWPPKNLRTTADAYNAIRFGEDHRVRDQALGMLRNWVTEQPKSKRGAVGFRVDAAYAAAALFRGGGDATLPQALSVANAVVKQLGPEGRLYSTIDSVGAIALMTELHSAGIVGRGNTAIVEHDGNEIAAGQSTVAVEVTRMIEDDWDRFAHTVPLKVSLLARGRPTSRATIGEGIELHVKLDSYEAGDLVWVALPDALTRVLGGGQVKRFSVDFAGQSEVTIPLAATALTIDRNGDEAPQHFAVCVRNMFEEERAGNPGPIDITVVAPPGVGGGEGLASRAAAALRRLIS